MNKYCLKWNDFDTNLREHFWKLRDDQRLFDVTLATDDGQHLQAHKIILSAGSNFFNDIFQKRDQPIMLIYLKGINSIELGHVMDFMYKGEVSISQEELNQFIETGKELKIKGMSDVGELQGLGENYHMDSQYSKTEDKDEVHEDVENIGEFTHPVEEISDSREYATDNMNSVKESTVNIELINQIEAMIDKTENYWKCKLCGKTEISKWKAKRHAEIHIEGYSHACHICSKTMSTRYNLQVHISSIHSELFSCDLCGKLGMNKGAYRKHKLRNH